MIVTGLLWFDDDTHRTVAAKIAEAAERYRERIGYEPTTCQIHPKQMAATTPTSTLPDPAAKPRRRKATTSKASRPIEPPITLRLVPDDHLRPNYFFVGVEEGESLKRAPGWHDIGNDEAVPLSRPPRAAKVSKKAKTLVATIEASTSSAATIKAKTKDTSSHRTAPAAAARTADHISASAHVEPKRTPTLPKRGKNSNTSHVSSPSRQPEPTDEQYQGKNGKGTASHAEQTSAKRGKNGKALRDSTEVKPTTLPAAQKAQHSVAAPNRRPPTERPTAQRNAVSTRRTSDKNGNVTPTSEQRSTKRGKNGNALPSRFPHAATEVGAQHAAPIGEAGGEATKRGKNGNAATAKTPAQAQLWAEAPAANVPTRKRRSA